MNVTIILIRMSQKMGVLSLVLVTFRNQIIVHWLLDPVHIKPFVRKSVIISNEKCYKGVKKDFL
jgi:hypothetical protein